MQKQDKSLIWHIQGGLGKNIAGTALIGDLKQKYPDRKVILVVSHPEAFLSNPFIEINDTIIVTTPPNAITSSK